MLDRDIIIKEIESKGILTICLIATLILSSCIINTQDNTDQFRYGVYLSSVYEDLPEKLSCETLVVDAQYFSAQEIRSLHENNELIYSYINIGAIENFREYYDKYQDVTIGDYENWPEERFIDVSQENWQMFIVNELAQELISKGIDGFFVDNVDVYYEYKSDKIYNGITSILTGLKDTGLQVIVNGGDVYVSEYFSKNGNLSDILDGVNQEGVFTTIDWEENLFKESTEESTNYYLDYLKTIEDSGITIFLLEYTTDDDLSQKISAEADKLGYNVYISDSIELD